MLNIAKVKEKQKNLEKIREKLYLESRSFKLFSDPTRLKIVYLLGRNKELCVTDIAKILNLKISAISHQLKILEDCGIVIKTRMGKVICYNLNKKAKRSINLLKLFN